MLKKLALLSLLLPSALAGAATYTFTPDASQNVANVRVKIDAPAMAFRMPAWAPGDYEIFNYGKFVTTIRFFRSGREVNPVRGDDPNLWTLPDGADEARYVVKPSGGNFSPNLWVKPEQAFVSGPGVFGWFDGRTRENQTLHVSLQTEGARAYCALDPIEANVSGVASFTAPNYDRLIDSPFVVGAGVRTKAFTVRAKPHLVVAYGSSANTDLDALAAAGAAAAEQGFKLFGELPYKRYYFMFDVGGGGGGLEHLDSARMGLGVRSGAPAGLIFHEYFHAFNVKRIREIPLGPFDYTKPPTVTTLWWLEGVTDYYADLLRARAGLTAPERWQTVAASLARGGSQPRKVSAEEASRRVWEQGGSGGFGGVSYYSVGKQIGLLLDLAIRAESGGKHSLDDVIVTLYQETKGENPGYAPDRIKELCVHFGGARLGPVYDRAVKGTEAMPFEEFLNRAGGYSALLASTVKHPG